MEAKSLSARKLSCPKCSHSVCFRCREDWHGYFTSCETAVQRAYEGFGEGADRIVFCPMCRTKITRSEGCNHMTCAFCHYEFCYFCGGSADSGSNHWVPGFGCGATMMGSGQPTSKCCLLLKKIFWILFLVLIAYPILVLLGPALFLTGAFVVIYFKIHPCVGCCMLLLAPIPFAIGLCLDICWTPVALILFPTMFFAGQLNAYASKINNKN